MTHQEASSVDLAQEKINGILAEYQPEIDQIQTEGDELSKEGGQAFKFDLEIKWSEQRVSFDIPEVTMSTHRVSFDVPQVAMKTRRISFHTPSTRMVRKVIGKKPEFHGFKVKWTDIIIDVPELFMEEHAISLDIPEFRMDTTSITLDIPELTMERVNWVLRVPEFRLGDVSVLVPVSNSDVKRRAQNLQTRGEELGKAMQQRVSTVRDQMIQDAQAAVLQQFETVKTSEATESIQAVQSPFDEALRQFDESIKQVEGKDAALTLQLQQERAKLLELRSSALTQLDQTRQESNHRTVAGIGPTVQPAIV